jgi:hypothetical protein
MMNLLISLFLLCSLISSIFSYQFYVDPFITKAFVEKNSTYKNLTEAILEGNKDDSATKIYLKEDFVYVLEGLIDIENEIILQNYDSNYLIGMQNAVLIMKNCSFFIKDEAKLKIRGVTIIFEGSFLDSLIAAGKNAYLFLEVFFYILKFRFYCIE